MLPRLRWNVMLLCTFIFTIFLLTVGCNPIYRIGGGGDNSPTATVIRGTVVSTLSITPASMRGDVAPKLPVAGADVFIETMPDLIVKSDANGGFLIGPVPPGNYRVIARVRSSDNKTYKEISSFVDAAPVNDNNAGELELKEATLKAKGKLTNPDGSPLVGVTVRIWGEDATTDENGMFESPLMPPGTTVEFKIVSGGYQNIDLKLPPIVFDFEPNDNPPFVETTIPSSSDLNSNRNLPPTAILQSDKLRYVTGETVTFTATAFDPEGKTLTYSWIKPEGAPNLNIALNNLSATWVAPAKSGIATFSFKATDPEGLETIRSVVIAVNPGLQKPIDMKPLDFDIPAAPTIVGLTAGTYSSAQSFTLTGIEAGAAAEYSLDNGQTWQTYNSQVNISLPGVGQSIALVIITRQTDTAGNTSPNSESIAVTINGPVPTYTVTYHANGADGDVPTDTTSYASEETFTVKNAGNLSKTGYAFAGWNTSANGNGDAYAIGAVFTIANSNVNLYAQWAVNSYTITYNLNEGTNHNDNPAGFNVETETINLLSPTKTGYTFAGWFNNAGLTGEAITQIAQGSTDNVTLYAKWTAVAYTITYNLNEGTNHNDNPTGFNVETPTITLQSPTKTGYTFGGWFNNEGLTGEAITQIAHGSTANVTLYAKWTAVAYTITYNLNEGTNHNDNPTGFNVETPTITLQSPTKTGYTFGGWFNNVGLTGEAITQIAQGSTANVNLYAKWTAVDYTITYNLNDGTNHNDNPTGFNVETETINLLNPTRNSYTFAGWFNNAGLTGEAVTQIAQGSTANVTLYAKWTAIAYTITYNLNEGTNHNDNPTGFNVETETINLLNPTRNSYTFAGWFNNEGLTGEAITQIAQGSTANVTLYAKWTAIAYTITYNLNEGTNHNDNPAGFNVETPTITLQSPTKTGYTFAGWFNNAGLTGETITQIAQGSTANVTLYAKWTVIAYTITYNLNEGTNHNDNPTGFNVETLTITLQSPTKTGYTFSGWFNNAGLTGEAITQITQGSAANVTLYAKWTAIAYTITYNLNEGTNHNDNPTGFNVETATITLQNPTKNGYTFGGWFNNEGLTGAAITQIAQGSTANVTLYAKWVLINYSITYNLNLGTNHNDNPTGFNFETPTITLLNPTRANADFVAWYGNADFSGEAITQIPQGSTANVTLYAKWIIYYTVSFNNNSGDTQAVPNSKQVAQGTALGVLPASPSKNRMYFRSWNTNSSGTGTVITADSIINANTTVYAIYSHFEEGNGTAENPYHVKTPYELYMTGTSSYWSKHFIQVADIDLSHATLSDASNSDWYSSEKGWSSYRGGGVRGVYDGNNKTVSNLYMKDTQAYIGLFYAVSENAIVKNLKLTNINIEGGQMVGGITGINYGLIQNCSVSGSAKGSNAVGGLVGSIYAGDGILGTVERCSANCTVTASIFASGGLVGHNYGSISNSHSAGTVNSTSTQAGGLAYTQGGTVTNCYSITVISDKGAGFSGGSGTITNCFWDTTVSGAATSGGGTGKTTAEMKTAATFSAWDSNIWNIQDGEYPTLK